VVIDVEGGNVLRRRRCFGRERVWGVMTVVCVVLGTRLYVGVRGRRLLLFAGALWWLLGQFRWLWGGLLLGRAIVGPFVPEVSE